MPLLILKKEVSTNINATVTPIAYAVSHIDFYDQGTYARNRNNTLVLQHLSESTKVTIRFISFELGTNSTCQNENTRDVLSI